MPIVEGKKAPAFELRDAAGALVSLHDFAGKNVVVFFYPEDDTPGCTIEACGFRDAWNDILAANAIVLGVSPDDGESHRRFAAKYDLPFPLLCDPDKKVMTEYGAWGEKKGREGEVGVIRSTVWIDPDGKVVRHWPWVPDAAAHTAEVREALMAPGR